jgi:hypothetical protein
VHGLGAVCGGGEGGLFPAAICPCLVRVLAVVQTVVVTTWYHCAHTFALVLAARRPSFSSGGRGPLHWHLRCGCCGLGQHRPFSRPTGGPGGRLLHLWASLFAPVWHKYMRQKVGRHGGASLPNFFNLKPKYPVLFGRCSVWSPSHHQSESVQVAGHFRIWQKITILQLVLPSTAACDLQPVVVLMASCVCVTQF